MNELKILEAIANVLTNNDLVDWKDETKVVIAKEILLAIQPYLEQSVGEPLEVKIVPDEYEVFRDYPSKEFDDARYKRICVYFPIYMTEIECVEFCKQKGLRVTA